MNAKPDDQSETEDEHPVGGYAALMGAFSAMAGAFVTWMARSGREFPERFDGRDLALMTVATHKASRLLAKDRVTRPVRAPFTSFQENSGQGEVEERARGRGLRRAVGELLVCPYCLSMWIASIFAAGMTVAPRQTRWVASVLSAHLGADVLQIAYKKLEDTL
jgi:hypothetical protein